VFEEQIARGADWLDEQKPGWELMIDLSSLDLTDPCLCVLGQVFNHGEYAVAGYHWARNELIDSDEVVACGFTFSTLSSHDTAWQILNDEWAAFIKNRLNNGIEL
jgi:hypothetical protein